MARIVHDENGHELVAATVDEWEALARFVDAWDRLQEHRRIPMPANHTERAEWTKREFALMGILSSARLAIGDPGASKAVGRDR